MDRKKSFSLEEIPKKIFEDRWVKFAFGPQGLIDSKNLNLGVVNFNPGRPSLVHAHDVEEALFVLSGKGKMQISDDLVEIKENDFVYIPENTDHSIITEKDSLQILFIFGGKIFINK
ncbi:MAG: cupin domain-containing protein [Actinobacteria bacterium]|nr:cupin domain-containing protein [Actinomycetota bacterium]